MPKSPNKGEILTIKQVADHLKVTERTIYRLAAAKQIPAFKVGGSWRLSRPDIDSWIKQQTAVNQGGATLTHRREAADDEADPQHWRRPRH